MTVDSINEPQEPTYVVRISIGNGGSVDIYLDGPEGLAEFNRDPDGYAAALFDLSRDEYREWVTLHGTPLCGCMTKAGRPCSLAAASYGQDAASWKQKHRRIACSYHERNGYPVVSHDTAQLKPDHTDPAQPDEA